MSNDDFENYVNLVYDNTNVTETKPLVELGKILTKLVAIIIIFYLIIYFTCGILISNLSLEKQIKLEEFLSDSSKINIVKITQKDRNRLIETKNKILKEDSTFPKTSTLNIEITDNKGKNALCLPNGTIYITSTLYKMLDDEMLTFVIAHEMGHYKNRDHLMKLRKYIAANSALILISAIISDNGNISSAISDAMQFEDLNYTRKVEAKADLYAKDIILKLYGNTEAGVKTLQILEDKKYPKEWVIFSTHPTIKNRIKVMKK